MTNVNVYKLKDIIVLISYVILLALTFVVRIQMQSILTNPTSKVSPDIVHLQASNYTSQPLVAVGDILLPPVHLCLLLLIISCQPPNSHPSHSHILSTCAIAKEKNKIK